MESQVFMGGCNLKAKKKVKKTSCVISGYRIYGKVRLGHEKFA